MIKAIVAILIVILTYIAMGGIIHIEQRVSKLEIIVQEQQEVLNKIQFVTDNNLAREQWILEEVKATIDEHFATKLFIPVMKNVFIAVETEE